jgi:hypothetical protein
MAGQLNNIYSNNIDPYAYRIGELKDMKLNPTLQMSGLKNLLPISKVAIADTFHDLAQARVGYEQTHFNQTVLPHVIENDMNIDPKLYYKTSLSELFEKTIGPSNLEPSVNAYIENVFGLQPAYEEITYDDILAHPPNFNEKVETSNGSLRIRVPSPYTSFTHYLTQFLDDASYIKAQTGIATFIKNYLYKTNENDVGEIRFLFDANANQIGKIFRYPDSGGIRYNAMACTADSASSSDESLDPTRPNEYEPDEIVKVTSNFLTHDKYDINFIVNDKSKFGQDGKTCFSVNISNKDEDPKDFVHSARYFFGPQKNSSGGEKDPCGSEGASVSHIGKTMENLESFKVNSLNSNSTVQAEKLNKVKLDDTYNSSCIPIGDSRFLKLFHKTGGRIQTTDEINSLLKLLADYKRTGDYEQSLTLARRILNNKGNSDNYTFSSIDLLSTLFARLNGIPSVYQVGSNGTITLYKNTLNLGSDEDREKAELQAQANKEERINQRRSMMYNTLNRIFTYECILLLTKLRDTEFSDANTILEIGKIKAIFGPIIDFVMKKKVLANYNADDFNALEEYYGTLFAFFPTIVQEGLNITDIKSVDNFTLPFLGLIVKNRKSIKSTNIDRLMKEKKSFADQIEKNKNTAAPSVRDVGRQTDRINRVKLLDEEILKIIDSITYPPKKTNGITTGGGGEKRKRESPLRSQSAEPGPRQRTSTARNRKTAKTLKTARRRNSRKLQKATHIAAKIVYEAIDKELLDIINNVLNRSNSFLKDLKGTMKRDHIQGGTRQRGTRKLGVAELDTRRKNASAVRKKVVASQNKTQRRKPFGFHLRESVFLLQNHYAEELSSFSATLLYEFRSQMELLVMNYNYYFISEEQLSVDLLFKHYVILTYIVFFLSETSIGTGLDTNQLITQLTTTMENVRDHDKAAISLSIFSLVGLYTEIFHPKDYSCYYKGSFINEINRLKDHNTNPLTNVVTWHMKDKMDNAISLFETNGILEYV